MGIVKIKILDGGRYEMVVNSCFQDLERGPKDLLKTKIVGNKDNGISVEAGGIGQGTWVNKMVLQGLSGRKTGKLKDLKVGFPDGPFGET